MTKVQIRSESFSFWKPIELELDESERIVGVTYIAGTVIVWIERKVEP